MWEVSLDIYEDVSMAPGGLEQVRLQCLFEGAL